MCMTSDALAGAMDADICRQGAQRSALREKGAHLHAPSIPSAHLDAVVGAARQLPLLGEERRYESPALW